MIKKVLNFVTSVAITTHLLSLPISASAIENSNIGKGTAALINDVSTWLAIYGPSICAIAAGYCLARKSMADEADGKMWKKRIIVAVICGAGIGLVAGIIALISSYYK